MSAARPRILVSACLIGVRVRYDGRVTRCQHPILQGWYEQGLLRPVCPEMLGQLGCPRPAAERSGKRIINQQGKDVTQAFQLGANVTLNTALAAGTALAILKANSPSCGNQRIYDGSFSNTLVVGMGLSCETLLAAGIAVFNEQQLPQAQAFYDALCATED